MIDRLRSILDLPRHAREAGPWAVANTVLIAAVFALAFAAYATNPIEQLERHVAKPIAQSAGLVEGTCPDGWEDTSGEDEHIRVVSCLRDGWLVVLEEDGNFDYAIPIDTPDAEIVEDPTEVPGWR